MPSMKTIAGYVVGLLALLIVGYIVLDALGRDTSQLVSWLTIVVGQAATGAVLLIKMHATDSKVNDVKDSVDKVTEQTNGHMTALIDAVAHSTPNADTDAAPKV